MANHIKAIEDGVRTGIADAIHELQEEAIAKAVSDFEKAMRAKMAAVAVTLASNYDMYRDGKDLMIRVHLTEKKDV